MIPQLLISFQFCILSADYFLSYAHPKGKHPWLSKNFGVRPGKRPYAWEKNRAIFWSLVYPKCSKLEVYNPQVMILDIFSIIYKSNDPQIFHLHKKLWLYKLFMRLDDALGLFSKMHPSKFGLRFSITSLNNGAHSPYSPIPCFGQMKLSQVWTIGNENQQSIHP